MLSQKKIPKKEGLSHQRSIKEETSHQQTGKKNRGLSSEKCALIKISTEIRITCHL
jgi:hypothetical protein